MQHNSPIEEQTAMSVAKEETWWKVNLTEFSNMFYHLLILAVEWEWRQKLAKQWLKQEIYATMQYR